MNEAASYIVLEVDTDDTGTVDSILDGGSIQDAYESAFSDLAGESSVIRSVCVVMSPLEDSRRMRAIEELLEREPSCSGPPCSNARHALVRKLRAILASEGQCR